jgi:hypothetical protein
VSLTARRMDTRNGAQIYLSVWCNGMYGDLNGTVPGPAFIKCSDSIINLHNLYAYTVKSQVQ